MARKSKTEEASLQFPVSRLLITLVKGQLRAVATILRLQDNDRKDADDIAANVLSHVGDLLQALISPNPIFPPFPVIPFEPPDGLSPEGRREAKRGYLASIYSDKRRGSTRLWVEFALSNLQEFGAMMSALDADNVGVDDRIGVTLAYGANILRAVLDGGELPAVPEELKAEAVKK